MTREEAIKKIKSLCHGCVEFPHCVNTNPDCFKALEMAIKALEEESTTKENLVVEDCISRKDAEMCLTANITDMTIEEYISLVGDRLKGLSSVQPKPKTKWIPVSERLPEKDDLYLVYFCDGEYELVYCSRGKFTYSGIIAWMPLPKPYKAESED